jgi:hypothetical protein
MGHYGDRAGQSAVASTVPDRSLDYAFILTEGRRGSTVQMTSNAATVRAQSLTLAL